ncbi:MAG TPA: histidinol-phosphatase HisJ family protein [Bacteroidales bacterium]|nr:histidinol-phosphatase HisJ family protein [Bacteroidales bacterium]
MIYRTDYHVHTTFSDGKADPEEYITAARDAGLSEIGFSEHLTPFMPPQRWNMDPANIGKYTDRIKKLKETTTDIKIRTGLEVDFFPGREEETRAILNSIPLDYAIGSIHYQGDVTVDLGPEYYEGKDIDKLFESYFDTVVSAVKSRVFDIIGHCDLIRIYGYKPVSDTEHLYRKLAKAMHENNVAFEINTNGRNRKLGDFYPDRKFLYIFRKENVPVCVNSDAHMPSRVGQFFDEAYELLLSAGFTEMAVFENRKRRMVPLKP